VAKIGRYLLNPQGNATGEADLEHVRDGGIVASEMVRSNIADVIAATAARISKTNEG